MLKENSLKERPACRPKHKDEKTTGYATIDYLSWHFNLYVTIADAHNKVTLIIKRFTLEKLIRLLGTLLFLLAYPTTDVGLFQQIRN